MKKIKVGILCNIVVPYTLPVFEKLSASNELDVEVLYMAKGAHNRKWNTEILSTKMKFRHTFLTGYKIPFRLKNEHVQYVLNFSILSRLWQRKFDVIIVYGWLDFACQMTALFHRLTGQRYIVWSDSTPAERSWIRTVTRPFVSWFLRGAEGYVVSGKRSEEYLSEFNMPKQSIFRVPNTIDVDSFSTSVEQERKQKRELLNKYGINLKKMVVLFVGQFIHRKGVDLLLEAAHTLQAQNIHFVLVGYGTEESSYRNFCKKNKLKNVTIISGIEQITIYRAYAIADLLVLPSREETWGLVVNEAQASSLPVLVSDQVGSATDLVKGQGTGVVFQSGNAKDLTSKLKIFNRDPQRRREMGEKSHRLSLRYTPEVSVLGYKKAISHAIHTE